MCVRAKAARVETVHYNTAPPPGETPTRRQREEVRESTQPRRQEAVWWAQKKEGYPTPHQGETAYAENPEASPHHSLYSTTRRKRRTTDQRQGRRTCQWAPQETQKRHGTQEQRVAREVQKKSADPHWGIASQICTSATWEQNGATGERRHELTYRGIPPIGGTEVHLIIKKKCLFSSVPQSGTHCSRLFPHIRALCP